MSYPNPVYDAFIIGGGINGAAVANNLASKGFNVILCDENDLSGEASSHSNKLFQCGFDHLENLDLSHVSNSLKERDKLCANASHLMHPIDIVIPDAPSIRSPLKMKAATLLYGWLRHSETSPKPHTETIRNTQYSLPLKNHPTRATLCREYLVDDSRLVIENLLNAKAKHCHLLPKTKVVSGARVNGIWKLKLEDSINGDVTSVNARCVVNTAGAWAQAVLECALGCQTRCEQPLEKLSYVAIPKYYEGTHGYLLQLPKQQFLSVLPYANDYCLVGPLSTPTTTASHNTSVTNDESDKLIELLNQQFSQQFTKDDICWSFSTVKPANQGSYQPVHQLDIQCSDGLSPVLSVFSGHITTHRILAEQVYECLHPYLPKSDVQVDSTLPGGRFGEDFSTFLKEITDRYPKIPQELLIRYCSTYGARVDELLKGVTSIDQLGTEVIPSLHEREIYWLIETEWASSAEDILWRRTQLGISTSTECSLRLTNWFSEHYKHQSAVSKLSNLGHSERKAS